MPLPELHEWNCHLDRVDTGSVTGHPTKIAMKNIEQKIAALKEQVRELYQNDNDAPRLLNEMMKEFPFPKPRGWNGLPLSHNLPNPEIQ